MSDFWKGVTRGVTERGYMFLGEGLQKWVLMVRTGEGYRYHNFDFDPVFYGDTHPSKTISFACYPLVGAHIIGIFDSSCGVMEGDTKGRGQFRGREGGTFRVRMGRNHSNLITPITRATAYIEDIGNSNGS